MYFNEAMRSLYATRQRTMLALIGIIIGIGSVITLVSIGEIVGAEATKEFRQLGTDIINVQLQTNNRTVLRKTSIFKVMTNKLACVYITAPYIVSDTNIDLPDNESLSVLGVDQNFQYFTRFKLMAGRFISFLDDHRAFAVLGSEVAHFFNANRSAQDWLHQEIDIEGKIYIVIGILQPFQNLSSVHINSNYSVFIPVNHLLKRSKNHHLNRFVIRTQPSSDPQLCSEQVSLFFKRRLPNSTLKTITAEQLIEYMRNQAQLMTTLLTAIGSISLLVGGVGIMNIMLVSVSERKREIGIRRALGATRRDIRLQFLTESLVLSLLGGMLGVFLSFVATWYTAEYQAWEFFISWQAVVLGAGISIIIGVVFGFVPAHQAAMISPIQALRDE